MRTIMAFGFAALLSLLAIGAWSSATTHSANRAEASGYSGGKGEHDAGSSKIGRREAAGRY